MIEQISLFDGSQKFQIDKPIKLLELFGGYGSQNLSLKYLGCEYEHHFLSEWAVNSIQAYKDLHCKKDKTDYSLALPYSNLVDWLEGRISSDYSTPMTREQILRKGENWCRNVYNNMMATKNMGSITKVRGGDLRIEETDKFCYVLTYSFP